MRVIFVDDEPRVLDGIERMLFALDSGWESFFADSGEAALRLMSALPIDIAVSDMRMPRMDGGEFLGEVRERWPHALRIILSGHTEEAAALRSMNVAHQFLSKPCEGAALVAVIDRAVALRELLDSESLKRVIGRVGHLPPTPRVYCELARCIADPESDATRVASLLARDPALSAKVLQVANSAFFRRGKEVASIGAAVTRVGLATLRALVLMTEVFAGPTDEGAASYLQHRALRAALIAKEVCVDASEVEATVTAALLADVGLLIPGIGAHCLVARANGEGEFGHSAVGAYLLGLWGLPSDIVEAVAWHATPARCGNAVFGVVGGVHVAVHLACGSEPDVSYLDRAGVVDRLPEWKRYAQRLPA